MADKTQKRHPLLVIVSAPSGVGKTTICRGLLSRLPRLRFSVSHTTRPPRPGEKDGKDYYFVGEDDFNALMRDSAFVEFADNHGYLYGTSRREIEYLAEKGYDILFDIDIRGAQSIKKQYPDAVSIVIVPPSTEELRARLTRRGTETEDVRERRIQRAVEELTEITVNDWYEYIVTNADIDRSITIVESIYTAERHRKHRWEGTIPTFRPANT